jgi:hypothetical protein
MTDVECPVEDCEYEAPVRSVKSHITASKEGQHDGQHGMDFAGELRKRAERAASSLTVPSSGGGSEDDGTGVEEESEDAQAGSSSAGEDADEDANEDAEDGSVSVESVEEIGTDEESEEFGIPVPVNSWVVVGGVALLAVLMIQKGGSDESSTSRSAQSAPEDERTEAGLVSASTVAER